MTYQPGIPTGLIDLNIDYTNIQTNFSQLDTQFGIDHVPFSNTTGSINGYHESIHFNPESTTVTNPPNNYPPNVPAATPGFGQLFSCQVNDGIAADEALYYLSGGGSLTTLTRNFQPVASTNGKTFLPGGLILQWGTTSSSSSNIPVSFSPAFPSAIYNIQVTRLHSSSSPGSTFGYWVSTSGLSTSGFTIVNNDGHTWSYYWLAIGN